MSSSLAPSSGAADALLDFLRYGSELTLHAFANSDRTTVLSRRIFLFLRDTPTVQYGKAGTLHWTYIPSSTTAAQYANTPQARLELDSQRLPLHTLTDLRSAKQTDVFRHPTLKPVVESVCFSLSSNAGVEMNLSAVSVDDKDRWWKGIMAKLQSGRKQLLITNSSSSSTASASSASITSPSSSPMSPSPFNPALVLRSGTPSPIPPSPSSASSSSAASLSPTSLRRLLTTGAFFKKYDLDGSGSGHASVTSIYLWAEGVGKAGDLYWVEAKPVAGFVPPPSSVLPASHSLPLGKITDFMLRKKSVALKASNAPDACCFALVSSDKSTLNLECESKEVCKNWREGLINMLLTAGKQVVRADVPATPTASSAPTPSFSTTPSASTSLAAQPTPAPPALTRSPSDERDLFLLTTGAIFTLYYTNSKHQPEQAKITLFFVDLLPPSDPGALCWCNVGSKRMIDGQRLMLNTMKQMISGCDHTSFRHSVPGDVRLDPDCCFTIVGKSLILNLEAASSGVREGWMKGLHGVMLRYQQGVTEKKRLAQEMAAKAAKEILASNEPSFAQQLATNNNNHHSQHAASSVLPSPPSPQSTSRITTRSPSPSYTPSHSPSPSFSSPSLDDQIARLKKGDLFTLYTASSSSPNDVQSHAIFLFYVDDLSAPGYLYYCAPPPLPRQLSDNQRFSLASLSRMVAGKETAIFQNERMRGVGVDRCLSIIGKHSMLNVEAVSVEVRDLWIKTLHAIMTRYKTIKQQQQLQPGQVTSVQPVSTPTVILSPSGGSSPLVGSSPPSPSSTTSLSFNPLFNPSAPLSPHPIQPAQQQPQLITHSQSTPTPITTPPPPTNAQANQPAATSFAQEPEAVYLASSHQFKLYSASPVGFPSIVDIQLFFQAIPAPHADAPGALYWCPAGPKREAKEGCKLPLTRILQMAGGKETAIFRHMAAATVPKERCLYITSASVSLSLEAASVEHKNVWMQQLHALMMKMGRQTIEERKGKDQRSVSSPQLPIPPPTPDKDATHAAMNGASSAAAPSTSPQPQPNSPAVLSSSPTPTSTSPTSASKSTVDIKTAQQTVQAGQIFTLYHFSPTGEALAERLLFFFVPFATGSEQPGVLYWCAPDRPHERDEKRRFVLNTIKQMRAGKDTPILKSSIASKARSSHCLSLSSSSLTLNLEAPSAEVAELWRKSLHTVLVRNGMKAVEDQPAQAGTNASAAASTAAAAAAGQGASRPLNSSVASHINRTINFMDPTEFFSLRAKIGEGSYGAVYKAIDHRDGQAVAIKIIPFSGKDSLKLRKEIRTLRQCHSPFIVGYKGAFHKQDNVWIVMEYCFDPTVCVWLADGTTKRVDQLLPTDLLLDEFGEAISIVPNTLIGTVHFRQPLPDHPLHAAGSQVPTPVQGTYVPPPGTTTTNPGYQQKRRITGVIAGYDDFIVSDNHPLTVGSTAPARGGAKGKIRRAQAYHFPSDCNWQVGQAPAAMVGQAITGYSRQIRQRGGWVGIRPHYWDGGVESATCQPYAMGGFYKADMGVTQYRDPRAGPIGTGVGKYPNGYGSWREAQQAQIHDWNALNMRPGATRLGEHPVHVIESMPPMPSVKGDQDARPWDGDLALVKLSVPIVFPVNNYLRTKIDLAMLDVGLGTGVVDGVNYATHPCPRVYFRAAQLERALRLTPSGRAGVYAFNDPAALGIRAVMNEQMYRDASQSCRAAILAAQANPNLAAPVSHPTYQLIYANASPYQAIFPLDSSVLHAFATPAARIQKLVDYILETTGWVVGLWLTDGFSDGLCIKQSLQTEHGMPAQHDIPNNHSGVFERCRHWVDLLGLPAACFQVTPSGLGTGPNHLPSSHLYFHAAAAGLQIGHTNILRNLLVRCGVVVLPSPGATAAQQTAFEQLNKPRFWDAALPNRLGWLNETVATRRAFLAGCIDGQGTRELQTDDYAIALHLPAAGLVALMCTMFRQLGFRTGQPTLDTQGKMAMQNIQHHFADQHLLPIAILHKRTVGVGLRLQSPHASTFRILDDDSDGYPLKPGPVVAFAVHKPGRPCSQRLLLADGTITHNCAAGSLSDMMAVCKHTLSEQQISNVMKQSLAGLAYLHGQGKIHRDIKGGNILSDSHGMCKLADFGVSGNLDKTLGKHRTVIGTPHWMAPEVLMSDDYNELADIWSLGITAYELAVGEPPHAKLHSMRAALKIPMSAPPTLPDPGHWSEPFHSFLRSCLVKDFHARPSAIDLLSHPFIAAAPNASVLMDMVRQSVKVIEAKASELSREQGLAVGGGAGGGAVESKEAGGGGGGAKRTSGEVAEDELDGDDEEEEEAPHIRPNPRGN